MAKWREMALEMRRTAVNMLEFHAHRCDGDECNHFATWDRQPIGRWYMNNHACDRCIAECRTSDAIAEAKEHEKRAPWVERSDAAAIRELTKASIAVGENAR